VDNIVQNAIEAMPKGGQLTITCSINNEISGAKTAHVSFKDTGPGISEADLEHIFEPFHTGRDTGTGLGLAIARAIVEEHGGRLCFVRGAEKGASFVMELPLHTGVQSSSFSLRVMEAAT
jgi:signal transduction histidine kinase